MRRAFTLLDVLVSIAVIGILISILLPSLGPIQETARRVACQSNVRQIGLGVVMYADDWAGQLPPSVFLPVANGTSVTSPPTPQNMITLRLDHNYMGGGWDGLGWLYHNDYLTAPKVFYCPSHRGENPYRALHPPGTTATPRSSATTTSAAKVPPAPMAPRPPATCIKSTPQSSLIADGMRVQSDCNHRVGVNFFRADLTVHWYADPLGNLAASLPTDKNASTAQPVIDAWGDMDRWANLPGH